MSIKSSFYPLPSILADRRARDWTAGFLLVGMLMAALGSLMIAWRYQLDSDPRVIGLHFLSLNGSVLAGAYTGQKLLRRLAMRSLFAVACLFAFAGFVGLTFSLPPVNLRWRILGTGLLGIGAGVLLTGLLTMVRPYYEEHSAATVNFSGFLFGFGSLLVTLTVGGTYYLYPVQWETALLALFPLGFLILYLRREPPSVPRAQRAEDHLPRSTLKDLRSIAAVLFSLLLFFQFGNEWSLAGWLPLFLVHRLGSSPESAIFVLALYFASLLAGRLFAQLLLPRVSHTRLLLSSVIAAMLGYLLLSETGTLVGAALATVVTGLSFAPIYPLVAEKIGGKFDYQPGFYNGIFSLAIVGGMLAPWLLGYVGYYLGMNYIMLIPAFGSVAVLILMSFIMLESKLMSNDSDGPSSPPKTSSKAASSGK